MPKPINQFLLDTMGGIVNVRSYLERPVPEQITGELLHAFSLGPSLANTQPWELIIPEGEEQRKRIIAATLDPFLSKDSWGGQAWIQKAPLLIVVGIEKRRALARLGEIGWGFAVQDTFSAIQNFRILASLHSLSTSCVREFDPKSLREMLELPWYLEPVAILTAGYSEEEKELPPRLPLTGIVHKGGWQ